MVHFLPLIVWGWSIFIQIFVVVSENNVCNITECTMQLFKVNSRSTKVVDFVTNRKRVCDLLIVITSNVGSILHRFGDMGWLKGRKSLILTYPTPILITPSPIHRGTGYCFRSIFLYLCIFVCLFLC